MTREVFTALIWLRAWAMYDAGIDCVGSPGVARARRMNLVRLSDAIEREGLVFA